MGSRVLLVGMGGREHAIAWKLSQSPLVDEIFIAPGNPGTAEYGTNVPVQPRDIEGLVRAAKEHNIDFYLATMDDPQPLGLVDRLKAEGILCYGPSQTASQLESSKAYSKAFMVEQGIRTASARTFTDYESAKVHLDAMPEGGIVVKASGLAAGKGVVVCDTLAEAKEALAEAMIHKKFGRSGETVLVEERLEGWETSAHAFCDGKTAVMMPFATDYKRALTGDLGLNTGGMGAYSPSANVTPALAFQVERDVVAKVLAGMVERDAPFNGTLFPGMMVTMTGTYVIEFNARFGDPETEVLMPRLKSDLFEICKAAAEGDLSTVDVEWSDDAAVGVVVASGGYPGEMTVGHAITGLDALDEGVLAFQAGTARDAEGTLVTSGGRVVVVVATGATVAEARERVYANVGRVKFENAYYRTDIAAGA